MKRRSKENMSNDIAKMDELISQGMSKKEAAKTIKVSLSNYYYHKANDKKFTKRRYNRKPQMLTIPVATESDKICVLVGNPKAVIDAVRELLR